MPRDASTWMFCLSIQLNFAQKSSSEKSPRWSYMLGIGRPLMETVPAVGGHHRVLVQQVRFRDGHRLALLDQQLLELQLNDARHGLELWLELTRTDRNPLPILLCMIRSSMSIGDRRLSMIFRWFGFFKMSDSIWRRRPS